MKAILVNFLPGKFIVYISFTLFTIWKTFQVYIDGKKDIIDF